MRDFAQRVASEGLQIYGHMKFSCIVFTYGAYRSLVRPHGQKWTLIMEFDRLLTRNLEI